VVDEFVGSVIQDEDGCYEDSYIEEQNIVIHFVRGVKQVPIARPFPYLGPACLGLFVGLNLAIVLRGTEHSTPKSLFNLLFGM